MTAYYRNKNCITTSMRRLLCHMRQSTYRQIFLLSKKLMLSRHTCKNCSILFIAASIVSNLMFLLICNKNTSNI